MKCPRPLLSHADVHAEGEGGRSRGAGPFARPAQRRFWGGPEREKNWPPREDRARQVSDDGGGVRVADIREVSLEDLLAAGRVLFGPTFRADGQAWRADLKTTYRRRALETHPDRARAVGRSESDLSAEFRRVTEAYRVLSQLRAGPPPSSRRSPSPPPAAGRRSGRGASAAPFKGPGKGGGRVEPRARTTKRTEPPGHRVRYPVSLETLPRRRLKLAEYLYYSGRVPFTAFAESIAWQRRQRPPVGRIAVEWGFLEADDVGRIMEERRVRCAQTIPFGEFAVRLGYLTSFQLLAVLGRQLRMQRRIGSYFVERGLLDPLEIDDLRARIQSHNARWPR